MALLFEWNPKKAQTNLVKYGVSFDEASTVFKDTLSVAIADPLHSGGRRTVRFDRLFVPESVARSCPHGPRGPDSYHQRKAGNDEGNNAV